MAPKTSLEPIEGRGFGFKALEAIETGDEVFSVPIDRRAASDEWMAA